MSLVIDVLKGATNAQLIHFLYECKLTTSTGSTKEQLISKLCNHLVSKPDDIKCIVVNTTVPVVDDVAALQDWLSTNTGKIPVSPIPAPPNPGPSSSLSSADLAILMNFSKIQADALADSIKNLQLSSSTSSSVRQNMDGFFYKAKALHSSWDGTSVRNLEGVKFLKSLEELIDLYQPTWINTVFALKSCLQGKALAWFNAFEGQMGDFAAFKVQFKAHFIPSEYLQRLENEIRAKKQQPSQSMLEFVSTLKSMNASLETPLDENTLFKLVKLNCLPRYQFLLNNVLPDPCPMDLFLEKTRQVEYTEQCEADLQAKKSRMSMSTTPSARKNLSSIQGPGANLNRTYVPKKPGSRKPNTGVTHLRCHVCNRYGHLMRNCQPILKCTRCNEVRCKCDDGVSQSKNQKNLD